METEEEEEEEEEVEELKASPSAETTILFTSRPNNGTMCVCVCVWCGVCCVCV